MSQNFDMSFDPKAIFANLSEKERVYGHHSAEGRAIRTLSRALNGYSVRDLSGRDVIAMCDQAIQDWLKARLKISAWSATSLSQMLKAAAAAELITPVELHRLQTVHDWRDQANAMATTEVETALEWCIEVVDRHWL